MNGSEAAPSRNEGIELLRGLAALAVALVHLTFGFARFVDGRIGDFATADRWAQAAVAAFFVISGAVMALSAGPRSDKAQSPRTFLCRRAIRVLPSYWIATGLMVAVSVWLDMPVEPDAVVRSLAFVPPRVDAAIPFKPFLWPGWTLAFELVFYTLFGVCLFAGRARVVPLSAAALLALVAVGWLANPHDYLARLVTAPHLLLFAAGLGLGTALARGWRASMALRLTAGAGAIAVLALVPGEWGWLAVAGLPGALAFVATAAGPLADCVRHPARIAGETSYALYLLHVPFAHAWMYIFQRWIGEPGGSLGYLLLGFPLLLPLSLAFHRVVERPVMRALNRLARSDRNP